MDEWKIDLLSRYDIVEVVPDNVFLYKFKSWILYTDSELRVLTDLGLNYQILSIQIISKDAGLNLGKRRMLIVVGKK